MNVMFADPCWGVNENATLYGGIDLKSDTWHTCVKPRLLRNLVLNFVYKIF